MKPLLLDTCAFIWMSEGQRLAPNAEAALEDAARRPKGIYLSPITAWEIGQLVAKGRLTLSMEPLQWFERGLSLGLTQAALSTDVLVASSFLPQGPLRDPADKILAATARVFGYRLMTRDRPLLAFAEAGHLDAITC